MATPSLKELQELIQIGQALPMVNAIAAYGKEVTTNTDMLALKEHYYHILFSFNRVRELVGDTRVPDYNGNSPKAMLEYIADRVTEAESAIPSKDVITYTEPSDAAQTEPLFWLTTDASGSASA